MYQSKKDLSDDIYRTFIEPDALGLTNVDCDFIAETIKRHLGVRYDEISRDDAMLLANELMESECGRIIEDDEPRDCRGPDDDPRDYDEVEKEEDDEED